MTSLSTRDRILWAALSGLLFFLAFHPVQWAVFAWLALCPLLFALMGARLRIAALCGVVTTVSFYGLSVYWVFSIFRSYGHLSAVEAAGVQSALLAYLCTYRVGFCVLLAWISNRNRVLAWIAAPVVWVAMEFVFVRTPHFSLPWNLLGYAATHQPLILQIASVTGVYGLSFLMTTSAVLFASLFADPPATPGRVRLLQAFVVLFLLTSLDQGFGEKWLPVPDTPYTARLVQSNLPVVDTRGQDWYALQGAALDEIERLSITPTQAGAAKPDLIIWPEVPAPFYLDDPRFGPRAQRIAQLRHADFLLGTIEWRPTAGGDPRQLRPRNSAVLLGPAGERLSTYDKIHLVPFGEYVPLREWLSFAASLTGEVGGFVPGTERSIGQTQHGKLATLICFEAVFPGEVRAFVADGAELLVNISNDAWLGNTGGPRQHMEMARMRAVENRRWVLRTTNNGWTVVVDPYGRITALLEPNQRAVLDAKFNFRIDQTIYTRFGDWFAWLCMIGSAGFVFFARKGSQS